MFLKKQNQLKKIITWSVVFCCIFNLTGLVWADESNITDYCEKQLGTNWNDLNYTPSVEEYKNQTYSKIKEKYHNEINQLFNQAIQKMLNEAKGENYLGQTCTDKKISQKIENVINTYEISQKSLCRYVRYQAILKAKMNYITTENLNDSDLRALMDNNGSNLQSDIYNALNLLEDEIENELHIARISLNKTLEAYDKMLILYPLHLRLRCIISDLLTFRKHLAKLVNIFFCLDRYINASSDKLD